MKHWLNRSKHDQNQASIFLPYKGLYQNILGSSSQMLLWSRQDNIHSGNRHRALQNILQIYKQLKFNKWPRQVHTWKNSAIYIHEV